jgi:hypothetical protein
MFSPSFPRTNDRPHQAKVNWTVNNKRFSGQIVLRCEGKVLGTEVALKS